jgi:hypothetical protein
MGWKEFLDEEVRMSTMTATAAGSLVSRLVRGVVAGIGAGIVFIAITLWFADSMGDPARMPLHMIATVVQGDDAMMQADTNATVGTIVHLVISAGYGAAFAFVLPWLRSNAIIAAAGVIYGAVLYVVNFEILAPWLFTTLDMANKPFELAVHIVFGSLLGLGLLHYETKPGQRVAA